MVSRDPSHCPACGTPLTTVQLEGRVRNYCDACDEPVYRNPKPAAGVLVVDGDSILLVRRTNPPVGVWSLPAGFLEVDEPPRTAAVRELAEETGLTAPSAALTLFDTAFVDRDDAPTVLVVIYAVDRNETGGDPVAGSDAADARFFADEQLADCDALESGYEATFRRVISEFDNRE
jgi:8-oxo-dGTP diphosphatase